MNDPSSPYQYGNIFSGLPIDFDQCAIRLFKEQLDENSLYRDYVEQMDKTRTSIGTLEQIPFLPVSFFKSSLVTSGNFNPEIVFESSGTTGITTARHAVKSLAVYRESFVKGFEFFYGNISDYCIIGLLPAYLERPGSSLVYMVDEMIRLSGHTESGFYLYDFDKLERVLNGLEKRKQKTLLIGVSFALLDFAESHSMKLSNTIIMETGGMKGRRKEITRQELHDVLIKKLGVKQIHSEYGMTELLSQAYSAGDGIYKAPPWMKVLVRMEDDPLDIRKTGEGLLNIIDLANRYSCAFIATDDVTRILPNGRFEILGRMDNSDMRGCSLLTL